MSFPKLFQLIILFLFVLHPIFCNILTSHELRDSSIQVHKESTTGIGLLGKIANPSSNASGAIVAELAEFTPAHNYQSLNDGGGDATSNNWERYDSALRSDFGGPDNTGFAQNIDGELELDPFWRDQHLYRTNRMRHHGMRNYNNHHRYPIRQRFPPRLPYQNQNWRPSAFVPVPANDYDNPGNPIIGLIVKGTDAKYNIPLWNFRSTGASPRNRIFSDEYINL